jgi:lysophospholipase L1-like esterase
VGHGWRTFVALGDSFTEGLDDPSPTGVGYRGWADLVAAQLATGAADGCQYANLAIRGRLFDAVVDEQVPPALHMTPDLVSFAAGGNDVLRRRFDPARVHARFAEVVRVFRAAGADVLVFKFADVTRRLPARRLILPRVLALNRGVDAVADRYGATVVDLWSDQEFANPRLWSVDRLHLSTAGHHRVAAHVLGQLGLTIDPAWWDVPAAPAVGWLTARRADAAWVRGHLAPWVRRRLAGRSSGDTVLAKRPDLAPVAASHPTALPARPADPADPP